MTVKDGPSCPGCGLANYEELCPHCRGDQDAYEAELVPPFETSRPPQRSEIGELVERLIAVRDGLANPSSRQTLADAANLLDRISERAA